MTSNLTSTNLSRFSVIRPDLLGPMQVLEAISTENIIAARMQKLVQIWASYDPDNASQYDVDKLEFDPLKVQAENAAFFEALVRDRVNQATRSVTLAFAVGSDLDALATNYPYGCPRKTVALGTWGGPGTQEPDDAYRQRIWMSPSILSLNGPGQGTFESYVFWALSAPLPAVEQDGVTPVLPLKHASALTEPGTGKIFIPLMSTVPDLPTAADVAKLVAINNKLVIPIGSDPTPSATQMNWVYQFITEPGAARQGLTDIVSVVPAKVVNEAIDIDVWLFPGVDKATMMGEIAMALIALAGAVRWLGADLTLLALDGALAQAGVYNVKRNSPTADLIVGTDSTVNVTSITLTYRGTGE